MIRSADEIRQGNEAASDSWPPKFTLDQERILKLLTGDRFYSNASAALREAVLNAIDAVHRRRRTEPKLEPAIEVTFDTRAMTMLVADNGDGMSRMAVNDLFARVGASASNIQGSSGAVGEFGIGVISYFMAGESFDLQTWDGSDSPIGLRFETTMLAGGLAAQLPATRTERGTSVTIRLRDRETLDLLVEKFPYWCRDVEGLRATLQPEARELRQRQTLRPWS